MSLVLSCQCRSANRNGRTDDEEAEDVRSVSGHAFRRAESASETSAFRRCFSKFNLHDTPPARPRFTNVSLKGPGFSRAAAESFSRTVILSEAKDLLFAASCISFASHGTTHAARDKGYSLILSPRKDNPCRLPKLASRSAASAADPPCTDMRFLSSAPSSRETLVSWRAASIRAHWATSSSRVTVTLRKRRVDDTNVV